MTTAYERSTALVHLIPAQSNRHMIAIGPENQPVAVGELLPIGPAEKKVTAVRRILAIAFEEMAQELSERHASAADGHLDDDRQAPACCIVTSHEIADGIRRSR